MANAGKASIKRGKPSYFMSILGVTLVLFLLGIIGWLIINANKIGAYLKEKVEVNVYLGDPLNPKDSTYLVDYIAAQPYIKSSGFVTKEMAKQEWLKDGNAGWEGILDANPMPSSIKFKVKEQYLNIDSLAIIEKDLRSKTYVTDVTYPKEVVSGMSTLIRQISIGMLVIVIIIALVVIFLIDNTIRLAMFSNRFLIKTMQMVGATRWFIAKPMNIRAIINGAISGVIAIVGVTLLILLAEKFIPFFIILRDPATLVLLFLALIILGIVITLVSTHRSVLKYLRMKLDDLY